MFLCLLAWTSAVLRAETYSTLRGVEVSEHFLSYSPDDPHSVQGILLNTRTVRNPPTYIASKCLLMIDSFKGRLEYLLCTTFSVILAQKLGEAFGAWGLMGRILIDLLRAIPGVDGVILAIAII